ncbi:hypothetical protein DFH07DRAFT_744162 [Mycena maculata]|uniref:F-box domain-containing protein n=1 Tax=Mycena maculata TaxID=230809 RepID=A0AAD7NBM3_9AGAR|nr:hypothetical protein DFH07DRAFT_744162 [Mycena maculata]
MSSPAASRIPDEIVSEILTPLLTHPDKVFCGRLERPLLARYSSSTYLLVCKAWLRVSTPLLYNVVILRTTAQAGALQTVLTSNKEFGLFIKKLRVEGGFGNAAQGVLKHAPNITDLFLTLRIGGSDSVRGLCSGLALINPRCVIVVDADGWHVKPKENKQVTQLFDSLLDLIPKWDNLVRDSPSPYSKPSTHHNAENLRISVSHVWCRNVPHPQSGSSRGRSGVGIGRVSKPRNLGRAHQTWTSGLPF